MTRKKESLFELELDRGSALEPWGLDLGQREGSTRLLVRAVIPGSAAASSKKLRPLDAILKVGDADVDEQREASDFTSAVLMFSNDSTVIKLLVSRVAEATPHASRFARPSQPQLSPIQRKQEEEVPPQVGRWGAFTRRVRSFSLAPSPVQEERVFFHVAPRVIAVRGGADKSDTSELHRAGARLVHEMQTRGKRTPKFLMLNVGDATTPQTMVDALGGGLVEIGWKSAKGAHTPTLEHLVGIGAAVGAWLASDPSNVAVLLDSGGGHARVGVSCAAALRVALSDEDAADSAAEAYNLWLRAAGLESRLSLRLLPPSFARCLATLDAALSNPEAPNASARLVLRRLIVVHDGGHLGPLDVEIGDDRHSTTQFLTLSEAPGRCELDLPDGFLLQADFALTLRLRSSKIARFTSHAAFVGAGELSVPGAALDVFPDWRGSIPANFEIRCALDVPDDDPSSPEMLALHDATSLGTNEIAL